MNQNRSVKYEKMLHFQEKRLDQLKQKLAVQRNLIDDLHRQRQSLIEELAQVGSQTNSGGNAITLHQQCELAMTQLQRQINGKKIEIATADEKLDYLLHTYREQDQQRKSWEKLVEQQSASIKSAVLLLEMQQADERYLLTDFVGEQI